MHVTLNLKCTSITYSIQYTISHIHELIYAFICTYVQVHFCMCPRVYMFRHMSRTYISTCSSCNPVPIIACKILVEVQANYKLCAKTAVPTLNKYSMDWQPLMETTFKNSLLWIRSHNILPLKVWLTAPLVRFYSTDFRHENCVTLTLILKPLRV
jgi:hypothetical protein